MNQSNLSISSSLGCTQEFSQGKTEVLKGWNGHLFTQLCNDCDALPSYSPQTKFGLIVAINVFFLSIIRSFVNIRERSDNLRSIENAPLNHFRSTLLLGGLVAVANVAISKPLRYNLSLATLCAISASCVAIHLLLKKQVVIGQHVDPAVYMPNSADIGVIKLVVASKHQELVEETERLNQGKEQLEREQGELQAIPADQRTPGNESRLQEIQEILGEIQAAEPEVRELAQQTQQSLDVLQQVEGHAPQSTKPHAEDTKQAAVVKELSDHLRLVSSPRANKVRSRFSQQGVIPSTSFPSRLPVPSALTTSLENNPADPSSSNTAPTVAPQTQQDGQEALKAIATEQSLMSKFAWGALSVGTQLTANYFQH